MMANMGYFPRSPFRVGVAVAALLFGVAVLTAWPRMARAGSARDYLNAPIDTWLTFSNTGYSKSVTPGEGLDVTSRVRSDVFSQSVIVTRTLDVWGRTGGVSAIVPYVAVNAISPGSHLSNDGLSDIGFL
jgi:hypothetical protein